MPFQCNFTFEEGFLRARTHGQLETMDELFEYVDGLIAEAGRNNTTRLLLDERELRERQDMFDAYEFADSTKVTAVVPKGLRIACLCHPDNLSLNQSYETFLNNRSLQFKVFLFEPEALAWLLKP